MPQLIEAPKSTLKTCNYSFNSAGEVIISATDGDNLDASRTGGLPLPQVGSPLSFLHLWSPTTNDHQFLGIIGGLPEGYQVVRVVKDVA